MNERRGGSGGAGMGSVPPGTLESSVTLDEVFAVVTAKRVPLAPELAGYLSLEIAEGSQASGGEIDPRVVYIGDEGTVALVRPKRDSRGESSEAETSVRAILTKLLDASGSQTPSLGAAARRTKPSGMAGLIEELEAALIPVNRAAGRRALARLAREVKRVTLGVGRNASRPSSPSYASAREAREGRDARDMRDEPPPSRAPSRPFGEESSTARREVTADVLSSAHPSQPEVRGSEARSEARPAEAKPAPAPLPPREPTPAPPVAALVPVQLAPAPIELDQLPTMEINKEQNEALQPSLHTRDAVDHLLESFGVSDRGEQVASRELKALVGLEPTPPPPGQAHDVVFSPEPPAAASKRDARDALDTGSDQGADVESLLAMSEPGPPVIERTRAPVSQLESPPTSISPALANEPIGAPVPASAPSSARARSHDDEPRPIAPEANVRARAASVPSSPSLTGASTSAPTAPSMRKLAHPSGGEFSAPRAPREGRFLTLAALFILAAGGAAIWTLRPSFFTGHSDRTDTGPARSAGGQPSATPAPARCKATLVVTDVPQGAEVLLRVGQAPTDVERMPVGARLEFVATAEGYAPKRTVVPAGAPWDPGADGKPRFEVAVQLDKSRARPGTLDGWPAGEPGSEVGGKGAPGTVHIVSTPRGAELWLLAGIGPEAKIDQLKCGADIDVLVAGPTTLRRRVHVASTDFKAPEGGGDATATVSARK